MDNEEAENMRKKYLYRRLIMTRKVKLQRKGAIGLVGPDCAYHLYAGLPTKNPGKENKPLVERGSNNPSES